MNNHITKDHDKVCLQCGEKFFALHNRHNYCINCRAEIRRTRQKKRNGRKGYLKTRFQLLTEAEFTCQYCGRQAPEVVLEIDHKLAINQGGKDEVNNWIVACRDCNQGKSDCLLELRK